MTLRKIQTSSRLACGLLVAAAGLLLLSGGCPARPDGGDGPPLRGDIDGDGALSTLDVDALSALFGQATGSPLFVASADLNQDGVIGLADLQLLIGLLEE